MVLNCYGENVWGFLIMMLKTKCVVLMIYNDHLILLCTAVYTAKMPIIFTLKPIKVEVIVEKISIIGIRKNNLPIK